LATRIAPCSVNAYGRYLMFWPRPLFKLAICDLERPHLLGGELEHEIFGKAIAIALDLFVQTLGGSAVDRSQFAIENDTLAAQDQDRAADLLDRHRNALFLHNGL
jgi:hypothetical protein